MDARVEAVMARYGIRGASVAVMRHGRLVLAHGYGHPRNDETERTSPSTRFRLASLTKPITSVAIHRLHQEGRLSLDARVVSLLGLVPLDASRFDPRWNEITVRHLLCHAGGFDRMASFDPMFANARFAKEAGRRIEPDTLDAIDAQMLTRPLDFDPGTDQAYSNYGYTLLGRVIEHVTGTSYERYVRETLLAPMGIRGIELGHELPADRPADESFYFPDADDPPRPNLFSAERELVPASDGGFFMAPMAAHGGLIGSAVEYARFLTYVDGLPDPPDILEPQELEAMLARPDVPAEVEAEESDYYADGFDVEFVDGERIWSHTGMKPGTTSLAVRYRQGWAYVALANGRPLRGELVADLDRAIREAMQMP